MSRKDSRIDAYIEQSAPFARPILKRLRRIVHAACPDVEETMKWSFPHFLHHGMLCSTASFKAHCSFGFWKRALVVGKKAEEGAMGQFGRLTALADLPPDKVLAGYIRKAMELNETGVRPPTRQRSRTKKPLLIPDDLKHALRKNKSALATFENFSYSHQKEYVEWITEAKRDETRTKRLATTLQWLSAGKPRHWKYVDC